MFDRLNVNLDTYNGKKPHNIPSAAAGTPLLYSLLKI